MAKTKWDAKRQDASRRVPLVDENIIKASPNSVLERLGRIGQISFSQ